MDSQVTGILDLTFVERPSGHFLLQVGPSWCIDRNDRSPTTSLLKSGFIDAVAVICLLPTLHTFLFLLEISCSFGEDHFLPISINIPSNSEFVKGTSTLRLTYFVCFKGGGLKSFINGTK